MARVVPEPMRRFRFDRDGVEAAVIETIGEDSETVEDVAACPSTTPTTL